jgi:hypothetical protein
MGIRWGLYDWSTALIMVLSVCTVHNSSHGSLLVLYAYSLHALI